MIHKFELLHTRPSLSTTSHSSFVWSVTPITPLYVEYTLSSSRPKHSYHSVNPPAYQARRSSLTIERVCSRRDVQQPQVNSDAGAENQTAGDERDEGVRDLPSPSCNYQFQCRHAGWKLCHLVAVTDRACACHLFLCV